VSPNGQSVYVVNRDSVPWDAADDGISQYTVGPGGKLSPKSPPGVEAYQAPTGLAVSPDGLNAYVAWIFSGGSSCCDFGGQYDIGPGGRLSQDDFFTIGGCRDGRNEVTVRPDGQSAYITTGCGFVRQYDRAAGGALTPKSPAAVVAGQFPRGLAMSANGTNLYVANFNSDNVSQYTAGAGGKLVPKSPSKVAAGNQPVGVAANPPAIP
jgi:DNA-binding beta-propeller fold protein YncE